MTIASTIREGRAIGGRSNVYYEYYDANAAWRRGGCQERIQRRDRTYYRIAYDPCDVQLSVDFVMNREELDCMLRVQSLMPGTVVESTHGGRWCVVEGEKDALGLRRIT